MIDILDWVSRVTTVIFLVTLIGGVYAWVRGILPALLRLGYGLSRRKIAIFADVDHMGSLESGLIDTKLFNKRNVIEILSDGDIGRAEQATVFLIFWHDWPSAVISEILAAKKDATALVVYAPLDLGRIPDDKLKALNSKRNVTLVNFRGRLLNDIVVSLMTTSYQ